MANETVPSTARAIIFVVVHRNKIKKNNNVNTIDNLPLHLKELMISVQVNFAINTNTITVTSSGGCWSASTSSIPVWRQLRPSFFFLFSGDSCAVKSVTGHRRRFRHVDAGGLRTAPAGRRASAWWPLSDGQLGGAHLDRWSVDAGLGGHVVGHASTTPAENLKKPPPARKHAMVVSFDPWVERVYLLIRDRWPAMASLGDIWKHRCFGNHSALWLWLCALYKYTNLLTYILCDYLPYVQ